MDESMAKRIKLALEIMAELKNRRDHINNLTRTIGESSNEALKQVYEVNQDKIRGKVELFNKNVAEAKDAYSKITETVNSWHALTGDDNEQIKPLFPFRLIKRRYDAKKSIRSCKETMNSLIIKNRFLREEIIRLEGTLEYEATQKLRADTRFDDYNSHIKQKAFLLDTLQYLLPTIPKPLFREINVDNIEVQIEALSRVLETE